MKENMINLFKQRGQKSPHSILQAGFYAIIMLPVVPCLEHHI